MSIAQVGWQLSEGARALHSFLVMLQEAAKACRLTAKKEMSLEYAGFSLDKGKYGVGITLTDPNWIWFNTRCKIDPDLARQLPGGEVTSENWIPGKFRWSKSVDLESEEVHFFSRSKVGQMQWLEEFLRDCLTTARSIETADQPPVGAQPDSTD